MAVLFTSLLFGQRIRKFIKLAETVKDSRMFAMDVTIRFVYGTTVDYSAQKNSNKHNSKDQSRLR